MHSLIGSVIIVIRVVGVANLFVFCGLFCVSPNVETICYNRHDIADPVLKVLLSPNQPSSQLLQRYVRLGYVPQK